LMLLLPISILPWPTELIADAAKNGTVTDGRVTVIIYGVTMVLIAIGFNSCWRYILRRPDLLHPWVSEDLLVLRNRRYNMGLPIYPIVTVVGWFSLPTFLVINLIMTLLYLMPTPD